MKHKTSSLQIKEGDVMLVKSSEKNQGDERLVSWPIYTTEKLMSCEQYNYALVKTTWNVKYNISIRSNWRAM